MYYTYGKEYENGADGRFVDGKGRGIVEALVLVAVVRGQADQPGRGLGRVGADGGNSVILEDEDDAEEDDIGDNDEHNGNTAPLELDDAADTAVGLAGRHRTDAVAVRRQARVLGRGGVIVERGEVDLDAVAESDELDDNGQTGKDEQRNPEISQAVLVVDVTSRAETERDTTEDDGHDSTENGDAPAGRVRHPHEAAADDNLPANLQMQRQRAQKDPDNSRPTTENEQSTRSTADAARVHAIRRDGVGALVGLASERDNETEVHKHDADRQADTEVVAVGLLNGQEGPGQQERDTANRTDDGDPVSC